MGPHGLKASEKRSGQFEGQHEPVPDAQHQVAMQQAVDDSLKQQRNKAGTHSIDSSPTTRVSAHQQEDNTDLVIKSTTPTAVFFMTLAMAACSGLGAVPFFFVGALSKEWAALANAVACGVMLAASFDLLHEGQPYGAGLVILGLLSGVHAQQAKSSFLATSEHAQARAMYYAS